MTDTRIMTCETCGGDGYFCEEGWVVKCGLCKGEGTVDVVQEPVSLDDLDEEAPPLDGAGVHTNDLQAGPERSVAHRSAPVSKQPKSNVRELVELLDDPSSVEICHTKDGQHSRRYLTKDEGELLYQAVVNSSRHAYDIEPQHTPLPWKNEAEYENDPPGFIHKDCEPIADCWMEGAGERAGANAEFIVKAANSYYGLQATISRLTAAVEHALARFECLVDEFADSGGHTDEALRVMSEVDADRMSRALTTPRDSSEERG